MIIKCDVRIFTQNMPNTQFEYGINMGSHMEKNLKKD